jgi:hypothetical protein
VILNPNFPDVRERVARTPALLSGEAFPVATRLPPESVIWLYLSEGFQVVDDIA